MTTANESCCLPMDGRNACPPEAHSCVQCRWWGRPQSTDGAPVAPMPEVTPTTRDLVLATLRAAGRGLTFVEVSRFARLNINTVRARLSELEAGGYVERKGRKGWTRHHRRAARYVIVGELATPTLPPAEVAP